MSDKIKKTPLEESLANFEEIQNFAKELAQEEMQKKLDDKLMDIINESIKKETVNEDVKVEVDGMSIEVSDDGNVSVKQGDSEMELDSSNDIETESPEEEDEEEFVVSDEEDEITVDKSIDEMEDLNMEEAYLEQEAPQAPQQAAPAEMPAEAPVEAPAEMPAEAPVEEPAEDKIVDGIKELIQQMSGGADVEGAVEVIDDEAMGAEMPAEAPAEAPIMEDNFEAEEELTDMEYAGTADNMADMEYSEDIVDDDIFEIVDEMQMEEDAIFEVVDEEMYEEDALEETGRGESFSVRGTGDRTKKKMEGGKHAPVTSLGEGKIKAQDESKLGELIKENNSLKDDVKDHLSTINEYKESFIELRNQFNEMINFNAKLAYANKIFANGGFTVDEKKQFAEQFDRCDDSEDAKKLYQKIIKENNLNVNGKTISSAIKSPVTNAIKPKSVVKPLHESVEVRRMKELAGINKINDEI